MNERGTRALLAAFARELWERRLVTGTSGNLSARLESGELLVSPAGRSLRNLDADEFVRTVPDGAPVDPHARPSSELPLHVAAYAARPEVCAVVHTHPTFCVLWSTFGRVFERNTVGAKETLGEVAWTPYRPPGSQELAAIAAAEFARGIDAVLMERHGLSTIGRTLEEAFVLTDLAEEAARLGYFSRLAEGGSASVGNTRGR